MQDAFVAMWSSCATYEPARGTVAGWVMSIVRHRAIYLARRRSVAVGRDEGAAQLDDQAALDDVPTDFVAHAEPEQLTRLLACLPLAQREVIQLGVGIVLLAFLVINGVSNEISRLGG